MTAPRFEEIALPPEARAKGGHEILRCAVVEGAVSIGLRRSFDDPFVWGTLFADLARHAAHIYAAETGMDEEEALARIREGLETQFDNPSTTGSSVN